MYVRKKTNKPGSVSVQIFTKIDGKYKLIKSIGSSKDKNEVDKCVIQANEEIRKMSSLQSMFVFEKDQLFERIELSVYFRWTSQK